MDMDEGSRGRNYRHSCRPHHHLDYPRYLDSVCGETSQTFGYGVITSHRAHGRRATQIRGRSFSYELIQKYIYSISFKNFCRELEQTLRGDSSVYVTRLLRRTSLLHRL